MAHRLFSQWAPLASSFGEHVPLRPREYSVLPYRPSVCSGLHRSQSDGVLNRARRYRRNSARNCLPPRAIYIIDFISPGTAPVPVGAVVTTYEPPVALDFIRSSFSPDARPFVLTAAARGAFINTYGYYGYPDWPRIPRPIEPSRFDWYYSPYCYSIRPFVAF